jgi:hypothetical protein
VDVDKAFWDFLGNHWTIVVFLPVILLVIGGLAAVTHAWDNRS